MIDFTPIIAADSKIHAYPIKFGQIFFSTDTHTIYLDVSNETRKAIRQVDVIMESERQGMLAPIIGFYYVLDKNALYYYDTDWKLINDNTPSLSEDGVLIF